jgi:DNA polymerase-3 subunit delta'
VADLLVRRDGIPDAMARYAARAAQSHVGMARRLARDEGARNRRHEIVSLPRRIRGVVDAVGAAADLAGIADEEAGASGAARDADERARLLQTLGADPGARSQPPHIRAQLSALEREQKARATRHGRDVVDRALVDLLSMYRDALMVRTGAGVGLINADVPDQVRALASALSAERLLTCMEAIGQARERINLNVPPLLALEAMAVSRCRSRHPRTGSLGRGGSVSGMGRFGMPHTLGDDKEHHRS